MAFPVQFYLLYYYCGSWFGIVLDEINSGSLKVIYDRGEEWQGWKAIATCRICWSNDERVKKYLNKSAMLRV